MKNGISLSMLLLAAACAARQEEPPMKQAEAYVGKLGDALPAGTPLKAAIARLQADGFQCREAGPWPMPMGHSIACANPAQPAWDVALQGDNDGRLTAVRAFERTAKR